MVDAFNCLESQCDASRGLPPAVLPPYCLQLDICCFGRCAQRAAHCCSWYMTLKTCVSPFKFTTRKWEQCMVCVSVVHRTCHPCVSPPSSSIVSITGTLASLPQSLAAFRAAAPHSTALSGRLYLPRRRHWWLIHFRKQCCSLMAMLRQAPATPHKHWSQHASEHV